MRQEGEEEEETANRQFILTWVQPGLAGLMDGSVSTLAPIFARPLQPKIHGPHSLSDLRPRLGRGFRWALPKRPVMMASFRRGSPIKRGIAAGVMTTLGGLGLLSLFDPGLYAGNQHRDFRRVRRTLGDCLDTEPIHANPIFACDVSGGFGWCLVFAAGALMQRLISIDPHGPSAKAGLCMKFF